MSYNVLQATIEAAFESRANITAQNASPEVRSGVETVLGLLDAGKLRVAEKLDGTWRVNEWLKKAVLLSFRIADNAAVQAGALNFYDKVPLKYDGWEAARFAAAGVRVVPPATVRRGAALTSTSRLRPDFRAVALVRWRLDGLKGTPKGEGARGRTFAQRSPRHTLRVYAQ